MFESSGAGRVFGMPGDISDWHGQIGRPEQRRTVSAPGNLVTQEPDASHRSVPLQCPPEANTDRRLQDDHAIALLEEMECSSRMPGQHAFHDQLPAGLPFRIGQFRQESFDLIISVELQWRTLREAVRKTGFATAGRSGNQNQHRVSSLLV
jgi:hypothetical protein